MNLLQLGGSAQDVILQTRPRVGLWLELNNRLRVNVRTAYCRNAYRR